MKEYYTVGEMAKQMNVTVRTLQYYDKIDLLKPSKKSDGGRRLYDGRDMLRLHQILSLKYLGFSLDDIQSHILTLETPGEVVEMIKKQILSTEQAIHDYKKSVLTMKKMVDEIERTQYVDFQKYANIITLIRNNNENYWVVSGFDQKMMNHICDNFKDNPENGLAIYHKYEEVLDKATTLKNKNIPPDSEQGITLAKEWWDMVMDFAKGDMSILQNLEKFNDNKDLWEPVLAEKQKYIDDFIEIALKAYFKTQGMGNDNEDVRN